MNDFSSFTPRQKELDRTVKVYCSGRPLARVYSLGYFNVLVLTELSETKLFNRCCHCLGVTELQPPSLEIR